MNSDPKNNENSSIEDAAISPAQDSSQQFTWLWKDLLFILLSIAAILILGAAIFAAVFLARGESLDDLLQPTINQTLALAALESIALILGVYLFGLRRKNLTWDAVGIRSTSWTWIIISIVVTLTMIPIVSIVTLIVLFVSGCLCAFSSL